MDYERILRGVRRHPALWGDMGPEKEAQAARIIARCKKRLEPVWERRVAAFGGRRNHWMYAAEGQL